MNIFITADTHFGHVGVTKFLGKDGVTKLRPWDDVDEMDEALIKNWNSVVRPKDRVYHLGDVVLNRKAIRTLGRLNGDKVLVKGNHDIFKLNEYQEFFRDIRAYHIMDNILFSHIPVHPDSKGRFAANVHGHTHDRCVLGNEGTPDHWYIPVSVEQTNYTPISFEEIRKKVWKTT